MRSKPNYKNIGIRIRNEREFLGITREKFAELVGLSPVYVGQIERGERKMSMDSLVNISQCLHTSIDYLVFGSNMSSKINDDNKIDTLLEKCSDYEINIINDVIKVILPHIK